MRRRMNSLFGLALLGLIILPGLAQEKPAEPSTKPAPAAKSPPATLADVAWMAGRWTGEAFGGETEEIWSEPKAGAMMGMFRLVTDGKPAFYELIVISEENGSLIMRLKHFNADMTGWEEKAKTIDFPLVSKSADEVRFQGLTVRREGENAAAHILSIRQKDGTVKEETLRYVRKP